MTNEKLVKLQHSLSTSFARKVNPNQTMVTKDERRHDKDEEKGCFECANGERDLDRIVLRLFSVLGLLIITGIYISIVFSMVYFGNTPEQRSKQNL